MALDTKLKSDMARGSGYSDINRATTILDRDSTEALLKSIEKQLKTLNQSVADLEQEVNSCKNPDYQVIFSKIDSARCSIEKMLSSIGTTLNNPVDKGLMDKLAEFETAIAAVTEKQDRNDRQLAQTLRENANFQIQVRQGMQRDIDTLKEQQNGEQFNPILKELASMYVEYQNLLEDEAISGLSRKNLKALFEQMEDLLFDYDAEITRSEVGETRQTKSTKIIEKIPTAEQDKHNTIAVSRKPGVIRGRTVLYPEFVDVFVYDPTIVSEVKVEIASESAGEAAGTDQSEGKDIDISETDGKDDAVIADNTETIQDMIAGTEDKETTAADADQTNV